jgi:dynein heavy chain
MKLAISNGYAVLIFDVEESLDPSIETILGKQYKEIDGRILIKFGDQDIDFDKNFKLFLTTKIPNPRYLPEIFIKVTVINFTVTFEGLEEQLLADVVKKERPEIE